MKRFNLIAARIKYFGKQQVLADHLPVSRQELSNWERALAVPQSHNQQRLAEELHCNDIEELLRVFEDGIPPGASPPSPPGPLLEEEDDDLMEEETQLTPPVQIAVPSSLATFLTSNLTTHLLHIAHTDYTTSSDLTTAIQCALMEHTRMNSTNPDYQLTRRTALLELASLPLVALGRNQTLSTRHYEEILRYCTAALEGCWQLYRDSDPVGTQHAFECCSTYVPLLEHIAHDSGRHQKQALDLAAQYAILKTMLGWGHVKNSEAVDFALNALLLSNETGNISLQLSARTKLNWSYLRSRQYIKSWETIQEGEHILKAYQRRKKGPTVPSGMIGNFYSGYSMAQIRNGIDPDAALGIAINSEPIKGHIAFVEFTEPEQAWEAAWTYCAKGDSKQAMIWLERLIDLETLNVHPGIAPSESEGAANILTQALLQSSGQDMKHIVRAWKAGMNEAQTLKHERLYEEAMINLEVMRSLWRGEDVIRKLMPLTSHW